MKTLLSCLMLIALTVLGAGCSETRFDCRDICDTAQACMGVDIDVSGCTDNCVGFARFSPDTELQAEDCNDCLDVTTCGGAARACSNVCSFVVTPLD